MMSFMKHPFFRIVHWGPLIALSIVFSISLCTVASLGQWHNKREAFLDLAAAAVAQRARGRSGPNEIENGLGRNENGIEDGLGRDKNSDVASLLREKMAEHGAPWKDGPTSWAMASPYVLALFLTLSSLTLYYYLNAMWVGPGHVASKWAPIAGEDRACLQQCQTCGNYKPPRAHHCRQCGVCVLKMDHHCPWINNCVGHGNHGLFTAFLGSAVAGCVVATGVLAPTVYWALYRRWYLYYGEGDTPMILLSVTGLLAHLLVLGLAIGVVVAVGLLFFFQVRRIIRNRTGIEDWILEKANHRRTEEGAALFVYPHDLGRRGNVRQVATGPRCLAPGDGMLDWPLRSGCGRYALTVEQLIQKACKRAHAVPCVVRRPYGGQWVPLTQGWGPLCRPPCTDEPRIPLKLGDKVMVTRWKRYWLYGDCIERDGIPLQPRPASGIRPTHRSGILSTATGIQSTDTGILSTDTGILSTDTGILSTDTDIQSTDTGIQSTDTGIQRTDTGMEMENSGTQSIINSGTESTNSDIQSTNSSGTSSNSSGNVRSSSSSDSCGSTNTDGEESIINKGTNEGGTKSSKKNGTTYVRHRGWFPRRCVVPVLEDVVQKRDENGHFVALEADLQAQEEEDFKKSEKNVHQVFDISSSGESKNSQDLGARKRNLMEKDEEEEFGARRINLNNQKTEKEFGSRNRKTNPVGS